MMNYGLLLLFSAILVLIVQHLLAIVTMSSYRRWSNRFDFQLISGTTVSELLQKYSRIVRPLNLKLNAKIRKPAAIKGDVLLVDREYAQIARFAPNFYVLYKIESVLFNPWSYLLLLPLYIFELVCLIAGLWFWQLLAVSLAFAVTAVILSVYFDYKYQQHLSHVFDLAIDLLDLNPSERTMAAQAVKAWPSKAYGYVLQPWAAVFELIRFRN